MAKLNVIKQRVQRFLARPAVRAVHERANRGGLAVLTANRATATIGFWLSPFGFNRERWAVLSGKAAYHRNQRSLVAEAPRLRRNVHRLEKALIMEPRRPVFALDYIEETVEAYERYRERLAEGVGDPALGRWSHDVLATYFDAVEQDRHLAGLAGRFAVASEGGRDPEDDLHAPFMRKESPETTVGYDELLELAMRRRSVRWFEDRPVPRDLIDKALMVGRQSPSACNRQPFEYRVFDDPDLVRSVSSLPFGAAGYGHNIPTVIVLVGKQDNFASARDRHVIYIDSALSAMAFMFALETLGLASSVINWPDFEPLEAKMAKTIGLAPHERVVMLMAVGYPRSDGGVPFSAKKSLPFLRRFNAVSPASE